MIFDRNRRVRGAVRRLLPVAAALAAAPAIGAASVAGDPAQLIVQQDELPGEFALVQGGQQPGGSYVMVFMRPEVLASPNLPDGALLGVMASLELLEDEVSASRSFAESGSAGALRESAARSGIEPRSVDKLAPGIEGADEALAFRMGYRLQGVDVIEYRYRLRLANAVAGLIVSGRAGAQGQEPAELASQARTVARRQLSRLSAARAVSEADEK